MQTLRRFVFVMACLWAWSAGLSQTDGFPDGMAIIATNIKASEGFLQKIPLDASKNYRFDVYTEPRHKVKLEIADSSGKVIQSRSMSGALELRLKPPTTGIYTVTLQSEQTTGVFAVTLGIVIENGGWTPTEPELQGLKKTLEILRQSFEETNRELASEVIVEQNWVFVFVIPANQNYECTIRLSTGAYFAVAAPCAPDMDVDLKVTQGQQTLGADLGADNIAACSFPAREGNTTFQILTNGYRKRAFVIFQLVKGRANQ